MSRQAYGRLREYRAWRRRRLAWHLGNMRLKINIGINIEKYRRRSIWPQRWRRLSGNQRGLSENGEEVSHRLLSQMR